VGAARGERWGPAPPAARSIAPPMPSLAEKAERLAALHTGARPLLLPNAWDAASISAAGAASWSA